MSEQFPSPGGHAGPAPISVANLESPEQARLWLTLGPEEAVRTLVGALRTALVFADVVTLDSNQLLDGVFFAAVTPERLAWHLGLAPGAPLPLRVVLLSGRSTDPCAHCRAEVDRRRGAGPWGGTGASGWGVTAGEVARIDLVVADLECRVHRHAGPHAPVFVSSARVALGEARDPERVSVLFPDPSHAWSQEPDPAFAPEHVWSRATGHDAGTVELLLRRGQDAWLDALRGGRVQIAPGAEVSAGDLGPGAEHAVVSTGAALHAADGSLGQERPFDVTHETWSTSLHLRRALVALQTAAPTGEGHTDPGCQHDLDGHPCGLRHATHRSSVVKWLEGERVDSLEPCSLDPGLLGPGTLDQRRAALRWWNTAYVETMAAAQGLTTFTLTAAMPRLDMAAEDVEQAWGFRQDVVGRARRALAGVRALLTWLGGRFVPRRDGHGRKVWIDGSVVRDIADCTPEEYASLRARQGIGSHENPSSARDLALALRELRPGRSDYSRTMVRTVTSLVFLLALFLVSMRIDAGEASDAVLDATADGATAREIALGVIVLGTLAFYSVRGPLAAGWSLRGGAMRSMVNVRQR